jgi:hypothetical protein
VVDEQAAAIVRVMLHRAVTTLGPPATGPLPDVTAGYRGRIHGAYLRWIEDVLVAATGRRLKRDCDRAERRSRLQAACSAWPLIVAAPLHAMFEAERNGREHARRAYLRDAAEGVARVLWLALVSRAWDVVASTPGRPATPAETCALELLVAVRDYSFSFGSAIRTCASKQLLPLWSLGDAPLPERRPELFRLMRGLAQWRNDLAHGVTPDARLEDTTADAEGRLTRLLELCAPWLTDMEAWWSTAESTTAGGFRGAPAPAVWRGPDQDLWMLERFGAHGPIVRSIGGAVATVDGWTSVSDLVGWAAGDEEPHNAPDFDALDPMEDLVGAAFAAIQDGSHVWIVGPRASGRTTLAWLVTRALRLNGFTVVRIQSTLADPALSPDALRERLQRAVASTALAVPASLGAERSVPASSSRLGRWWDAVRAANPGVAVALVVDAIDGGPNAAGLYAWALANGLPTVFVTDPGGPAADGVVLDLGAWNDGDAHGVLSRHLAAHHPSLRDHHASLIAASQGRIGRLSATARAIDADGVLPHVDPARHFAARMSRLEAETGNHPGFATCLRHATLVLAEAGAPLTLPLLLRLLPQTPKGAEPWSDWLPLVLDRLSGLVDRIAPRHADAASRRLYGDAAHPVWTIAEPSFRDWLRDAALPPAWEATRASVQTHLAALGATLPAFGPETRTK